MNEQNYYKILGVNSSATTDDIKIAYRKLAMKYHPDRNPKDKHAEERFKKINGAYETLKDHQLRAEYDQSIRPRQQRAQNDESFNNKAQKNKSFVHVISGKVIGLIIGLLIGITLHAISKLIFWTVNFCIMKSIVILPYATISIIAGMLYLLIFYLSLAPFERVCFIKKVKSIIVAIATIIFLISGFYFQGDPTRNTRYYSSHVSCSSYSPKTSSSNMVSKPKPSLARIGR